MIEFILATIGLTFIVTQFYIFEGIRNYINKRNKFFGKLVCCTACMGFWNSVIIKMLLLIYYHQVISLIIILIYGFIGSFVCYVAYLLIKPLMDKYD